LLLSVSMCIEATCTAAANWYSIHAPDGDESAVIQHQSVQLLVCGTLSLARAGTHGAAEPPAEIDADACRATLTLEQVDWHVPDWHAWLPEQAWPQVPQLELDVSVVSQPLDCLLASQSPQLDAHAPLHCPEPQVRVAMFWDAHTTAQPPQLSGSFCTFTQVLPHFTFGDWQVRTHWPLEQVWPVLQVALQAPQLLLSVCRFAHVPLQFVCPEGHDTTQLPFVHSFPAPQAMPQPPQL
jgi:hypothetical protein